MTGQPLVYSWSAFAQAFVQKWVLNLASVKVWGLLWSLVALGWGALTGMAALVVKVFIYHRQPTLAEAVALLRAPGLLSGGEFVTLWSVIFGVREIYKTGNLKAVAQRVAAKLKGE